MNIYRYYLEITLLQKILYKNIYINVLFVYSDLSVEHIIRYNNMCTVAEVTSENPFNRVCQDPFIHILFELGNMHANAT